MALHMEDLHDEYWDAGWNSKETNWKQKQIDNGNEKQ